MFSKQKKWHVFLWQKEQNLCRFYSNYVADFCEVVKKNYKTLAMYIGLASYPYPSLSLAPRSLSLYLSSSLPSVVCGLLFFFFLIKMVNFD